MKRKTIYSIKMGIQINKNLDNKLELINILGNLIMIIILCQITYKILINNLNINIGFYIFALLYSEIIIILLSLLVFLPIFLLFKKHLNKSLVFLIFIILIVHSIYGVLNYNPRIITNLYGDLKDEFSLGIFFIIFFFWNLYREIDLLSINIKNQIKITRKFFYEYLIYLIFGFITFISMWIVDDFLYETYIYIALIPWYFGKIYFSIYLIKKNTMIHN